MRDIKFRVWDELNKIMYLDVDFIRSGDGNNDWIVFQSRGKPFDFDNPNPYFRQQIKIMEYSGLNDKNGVEIYEGDIVKFDSSIPYPANYGVKDGDMGVISFELAHFVVKPIGRDATTFYLNELGDWVVIGNIYKNPELLKI